jgi:hypothetical protein
MGKRGAIRVIYALFDDLRIVVLALAYGKNEIDDISESVKRQLNRIIGEVEGELRRRRRKSQ